MPPPGSWRAEVRPSVSTQARAFSSSSSLFFVSSRALGTSAYVQSMVSSSQSRSSTSIAPTPASSRALTSAPLGWPARADSGSDSAAAAPCRAHPALRRAPFVGVVAAGRLSSSPTNFSSADFPAPLGPERDDHHRWLLHQNLVPPPLLRFVKYGQLRLRRSSSLERRLRNQRVERGGDDLVRLPTPVEARAARRRVVIRVIRHIDHH